MSPRQFLERAMRCREHMLKHGKSGVPAAEVHSAITRLKPWLDAYPHANDRQVAAHIQRNIEAVHTLLPGRNSATGDHMRNILNAIINTDYALSQSRNGSAHTSGARN